VLVHGNLGVTSTGEVECNGEPRLQAPDAFDGLYPGLYYLVVEGEGGADVVGNFGLSVACEPLFGAFV